MNDQFQPEDKLNTAVRTDGATGLHALQEIIVKRCAMRPKNTRVFGLILLLAVGLRIGLVDLPHAWAGWHFHSVTDDGWWDYPCPNCPCPAGDNSGDGDDSDCASCDGGPDLGMPKWWVSEPMINLWLRDTPLAYQPSHGSAVRFQLLFKNRPDNHLYSEMISTTNFIFSLGECWLSPWRSYLKATEIDTNTWEFFNGLGGTPLLVLGSGGSTPVSYRDRFEVHTQFEIRGQPTNHHELNIQYTSGARETFGWKFTGPDAIDRYFLTYKVDPDGTALSFNWATNGSGVACLMSVLDTDGKTTTLTYTNINGSTLLHKVSDEYGHVATLQYDHNPAADLMVTLTNITDAAGLSSSMVYGTNGLTTLVTPYGTTTFTVIGSSYPAVHVNELGVRDHLYMYVAADPNGEQATSYDAWLPSTSPYSNTFDVGGSDHQYRNSFHWGPRQYLLLPAGFVSLLTNSNPSVDLYQLYATNYFAARQRHWLLPNAANGAGRGGGSIGQTLSLQRNPSPDGVTQGQITWYDYDGKLDGLVYNEGTMILPRFKAWLLPNGESRFIRNDRNSLGWPTKRTETYTGTSGSVQIRTNLMLYSTNNIDLLALTNAVNVMASSNVFNGYHQVAANYDALGEVTVYTYDDRARLTSIKSPSDLTTTNLYGADYYLSQTIDVEVGRSNSYTWSNALVYAHTDERGLRVTNTWDGLNRLVKTLYPDGTSVTNVYDRLDLVTTIDRMGFTNRHKYNGFRQMVSTIDALNRTNLYDYCDCGALSSITDPLSQTTHFYYDLSGRRLATVYADSLAVTNQYDLIGRVTNLVDSAGVSVTNWFNNQGLLVTSSNAFGRVRSVIYDIEDRGTNTVDANGVSITSTFDALDRLRTRTYPDAGIESFGYSARGLVAYTNQLYQTNFFGYDEARRKTSETNANGEILRYTNSPAGDLQSLTDGKLQTTKWNYDEYGRVTNKVDQAGTAILRYSYDTDNRLLSRWSAAKGTTYYTNDAVGNLTVVKYPVSPVITYAYDALNRVTNMVDEVGTNKYGYTAAGLLLTEDGPWASDTVTNSYSNRLRTSLSLAQPTGSWTNGFIYDAAKRLTNVTSQAGAFSYYLGATVAGSSLAKQIGLPNTSYITNTYDTVARLTGTWLRNSGGTILDSATYGYNAGNQRTTFTNAAGTYLGYSYDKIGQLKVADSSVNSEDRGYAYDSAWNLTYRTNNGTLNTFNVDGKNELTNSTPGGVGTFDGNGNLTSSGSGPASYTYDDENQLVEMLYTNGANTYLTELTYDGRLRLRIRQEYIWVPCAVEEDPFASRMAEESSLPATTNCGNWSWTSETHYIYDGMRVIQERDTNNVPLVSYTRGTDLSGSLEGAGGIGGLLARSEGYSAGNWTSHAFYHADGNGNVMYLVNSSQTLAASYRYDPFGNTTASSGTLAAANVYRFSSKEFHAGSGLYYYGYRWYAPSLQRWLNRDPIEEEGGINLYGFADNNPINEIDRLGLDGEATLTLEPTLCMLEDDAALFRAKKALEAAKKALDAAKKRIEFMQKAKEIKAARDAEDRLSKLKDLQSAQDKAKKFRPETKGPNANKDWEGGPRPKQTTIDRIGRSEQRADSYDD